MSKKRLLLAFVLVLLVIGGGIWLAYGAGVAQCVTLAKSGLRAVATDRSTRFLGKVGVPAAHCRGGDRAVEYRNAAGVDWANYYGTADAASLSSTLLDPILPGRLERNQRGIDGALLDLEYQRLELIQFNLFDNYTYRDYVTGRGGVPGPALRVWPQMRLPEDHPSFAEVGGVPGQDDEQVCGGELIRYRTLTGICNDIRNPAMGSTGMVFARNVQFESTAPRLGANEIVRNRHGDRLGLLEPDPQLISRKLFTRPQTDEAACGDGYGPSDGSDPSCDYTEAPFFNVLAAFWIQFMTHDWFSHLVEGHNAGEMMEVGCTSPEAVALGCRPTERMERAYLAEGDTAGTFTHEGRRYQARAHRTTPNYVTAWWDASQIYGYDDTSRRRVKRDPADPAKLLMVSRGSHPGRGETQGYLPLLAEGDPMNPAWAGQESVAFPDNFNFGLSFLHNLFAREHNLFVDAFRAMPPDEDSGLRDPGDPERVITYGGVGDDLLFEVARLVVAAEIAKIHTIEWTTQLLYNEPLFRAMNANWEGLLPTNSFLDRVTNRLLDELRESADPVKRNLAASVFAAASGIVGTGNRLYEEDAGFDLTDPDHVNGGVNHFGSPFNFPEEFITVYRLHPLVPDVLDVRDWRDPNPIQEGLLVGETFRDGATAAMEEHGLADVAVSMGRQRLGALTLQNHPRFLQDLVMRRLGPDARIDVPALDLIRDRERGVPRFNEFRRQYGLRSLTSFDDFIDARLSEDSPARRHQAEVVRLLREVYGTHVCDDSKVITEAQVFVHEDGTTSPITDCLGHPDGTEVDNIEDVDAVVGWLAEFPRPHGFAISETQFQVFILNASRRLFSDRFFTSSFRPDFYSTLGYRWVMNNGPGEKQYEPEEQNGHRVEVSPMKRVLLRAIPELADELRPVINAFDPWARDRGEYYCLDWKPRPGAESDPAFADWQDAATCPGNTGG